MQPTSSSSKNRFIKGFAVTLFIAGALFSSAFFLKTEKVEAAGECTVTSITMDPVGIPTDWYTTIPKSTVNFAIGTTGCIGKPVKVTIFADQRASATSNQRLNSVVFPQQTFIPITGNDDGTATFSIAIRLTESGCKAQTGSTMRCRYHIRAQGEGVTSTWLPQYEQTTSAQQWWGHNCKPSGCTLGGKLLLLSKTNAVTPSTDSCNLTTTDFVINPAKPVLSGWYQEGANKYLTWLINTSGGCVGKPIDIWIQNSIGQKVFEQTGLIPTGSSVSLNLKAEEISCDASKSPDCRYRFFADPEGMNNQVTYPSNVSDWWGYDCAGPCAAQVVGQKFQIYSPDGSSDPSGSGIGGVTAPVNITPITNGQDVADINSPCWDPSANSGAGGYKDGCYELISDLPLLGDLENTVRSVDFGDSQVNSFADFINMMFRFAIGAAGVLGVVMIIVEAWKYMTSTSGEMKSLLKGRILNILMGLVLLLGIVVLLQTINPDLLRLEIGIEEISLNIEGDSSAPTIGVGSGTNNVSYATLQSTGVTCSGSGGKTALPGIINSFITNKSKFTYSQQLRGSSCYGGSFCTDCSFTATAILSCAGITSVKGVNTATIFTSQNNPEKITSMEKNGNTTVVNGKALQVGDLLGWSAADNVPNYQSSGHVVMYMGNGKTIESHGPTGKVGKTLNVYDADMYWKKGQSLKWVIRLP